MLPYLASEVSKPQNPFTISNNYNLNAPLWPVLQHLKDLSPAQPNRTPYEPEQAMAFWRPKKKTIKQNLLLLQTDIKTLRATKYGSVLLAGLANRWCVHDWK